jgi:hypothetical protein
MILSTTSTAMARMQEMRSQKGQRWRDESLWGRDLMQVVLVLDTEELSSGQSRETAKEGNVGLGLTLEMPERVRRKEIPAEMGQRRHLGDETQGALLAGDEAAERIERAQPAYSLNLTRWL